jgi:hypothetical protein
MRNTNLGKLLTEDVIPKVLVETNGILPRMEVDPLVASALAFSLILCIQELADALPLMILVHSDLHHAGSLRVLFLQHHRSDALIPYPSCEES